MAETIGLSRGIAAANVVGNGTYEPTKSYSFAAHFSEIEVDVQTGVVEVKRVVPVHDVGRVIHPIGAQGQIEGGIQQGIGHTLTEDYVIDGKTGRSLNAGLVDYNMPLRRFSYQTTVWFSEKIGCVMNSIEFMEEWPVERGGLLHAVASETCYSAYDGRKSVDPAHKTARPGLHGRRDRGCPGGAAMDDRVQD